MLGYAKFMELEGEFQRSKHGLPVQEKATETDFTRHIGYGNFVQQKRWFEAILSTDKSQKAITSGELVDSWTEADRRFYHYKMDKPIYPLVGYFSARYKAQKFNVNGLEVEINALSKHLRFFLK